MSLSILLALWRPTVYKTIDLEEAKANTYATNCFHGVAFPFNDNAFEGVIHTICTGLDRWLTIVAFTFWIITPMVPLLHPYFLGQWRIIGTKLYYARLCAHFGHFPTKRTEAIATVKVHVRILFSTMTVIWWLLKKGTTEILVGVPSKFLKN